MSPFLAQTPQVQLGSITASGGTGSAVIALTPQTAALQIISPATITKLEVTGVQSGAIYYNSAPGTNGITNLPVNQAVDASVTVTITGSGSVSVSTVSSAGLIMTGGGTPLAGSPTIGAPPVVVSITTQGASYTVPVAVRGVGNTAILAIFDATGNADGGASSPSLFGTTWTAVQYNTYAALWICNDLPDTAFEVVVTCPSGTSQGAALVIINNASPTPVESSACTLGTSNPATFPSVTPAAIGDLVVACIGTTGFTLFPTSASTPASSWAGIWVPQNTATTGSSGGAFLSVLVGVEGTEYAPVIANTADTSFNWAAIQAVIA